jgi:hypothetical protein
MIALGLLTAVLLTQSPPPDSLPFHRGQWAGQFAGGLNFASAGLLEFRSPKQALVIDIRVEGGHGEDLITDSAGPHWGGLGSHADVSLWFGWRRYHSAGSRVAAYHSWGLLAGFTHRVEVDPGFRHIANGWSGGVFGDFGGSYFLTPRLSLGATMTAAIRYSEVYAQPSGSGKRRTWGIDAAAPGLGFVAVLYF